MASVLIEGQVTIPLRIVCLGKCCGWHNQLAPLIAAVSVLVCSISVSAWAAQSPSQSPSESPQQQVAIPFDFQSDFDQGRYGRIVGDLVWTELDRRGGLILPESMLDVRDWSERRKMVPGPDTPLSEMQKIVRAEFAADIGIWGKVERVAGHDRDVYDVWVRIADFSADPPRMIYQKKTRTQTVSEIPHVIIKAAVDRLCGAPSPAAPIDTLQRESRWRSGPNLVRGDFERGRDTPLGWDPLPPHVLHLAEDSDSGSRNRFIRFELSKQIAASTGVLYYSDYFPVEEGATYRFQCRWRNRGSKAKVFIKCYDEVATKYGKESRQPPNRQSVRRGYRDGSPRQRHEVYRSQQNLKRPEKRSSDESARYQRGESTRVATGLGRGWLVHSEDFTPRHTHYTPRWGRVMLYAYWPAGSVDWDDIVVKQIAPRPALAKPKERRPSLETKVRSEELERNR
jgi:hypothetical protein